MPANNPFSPEEQTLFSDMLRLRKSDNAHFRQEFRALGEQQIRFLEYSDEQELVGYKNAMPVLRNFNISLEDEPQLQPNLDNRTKPRKRRCTLL